MPLNPAHPRCQYCGKSFETLRAVNHHISATKSCSRDWRNELFRREDPSPSPKRLKKESSTEIKDEMEGNLDCYEIDVGIGDDFVMPASPRGGSSGDVDADGGGENTNPTTKSERFIEPYPGEAGNGLRKSKTQFDVWLENQMKEEKNPWYPFASEQEWALTKWLLKSAGQKSIDECSKLAIIREVSLFFPYKKVLTEISQINSKKNLSFYNSYSFLKKVDMLPIGPEWKCNIIEVTGYQNDDDGNTMSKQLEL